MGDFNKPSVQMVDTTHPSVQKHINNPSAFMQNFGRNDLANQASAWMANQTAPFASLEQDTFNQALPLLMRMVQAGGGADAGPANGFSELQFANNFRELADPAGYINPLGQGMATLAAATPIFERNLQSANANLATIAPGRFGSGIAQEGRDLNATAVQDFNLFANQAIQQMLGLEQQNRDSMRNFGLGARGLQQTAAQNTAQNQLGARGLQQGAVQDSMQNRLAGQNNQLAALQTMMQGAGQAANGAFDRTYKAGQFGLAQQQANINPVLQLLGLNQGNTPIVGPSMMDQFMNLAQIGTQLYSTFGGQRRPQGPGWTADNFTGAPPTDGSWPSGGFGRPR